MKKYKEFYKYLNDNNIIHSFDKYTLSISRDFMSYDLRQKAIECFFNIFELDTTIVFY